MPLSCDSFRLGDFRIFLTYHTDIIFDQIKLPTLNIDSLSVRGGGFALSLKRYLVQNILQDILQVAPPVI